MICGRKVRSLFGTISHPVSEFTNNTKMCDTNRKIRYYLYSSRGVTLRAARPQTPRQGLRPWTPSSRRYLIGTAMMVPRVTWGYGKFEGFWPEEIREKSGKMRAQEGLFSRPSLFDGLSFSRFSLVFPRMLCIRFGG